MNKRRSYIAALLRQLFWGLVMKMVGGVTLTGRVPYKPGILVVNHSSHADTAALFSILHWRSRPFAVAAKDYWDSGFKRFVANTVVATVFVERSPGTNSYEALRETIRQRLARGEMVILFPEGTRTVTGEIGELKSGAVRLASDLQVPLYPAALKGMHKLFPKGGYLKPRRMEIVFGDALRPAAGLTKEETKQELTKLREIIVQLKGDDKPKLRLQDPWGI